MSGKRHSEGSKKQISNNKIGNIPWNKGKKMSGRYLEITREAVKTREALYETGIIERKIPVMTDEVKQKISKSMMGKTLSEETKKKISEMNIGRISPMSGKKHSSETKKKLSLRSKESNRSKIDNSIAHHKERIVKDGMEFMDVVGRKLYAIKCKSCSLELTRTSQFYTDSKWVENDSLSYCRYCERNPDYEKTSKPEKEISEFITSLDISVENNVRHVIPPKELDIYIPEKQLAVEFNGLYWHSDAVIEDKNRTKRKHIDCDESDIRLITIFEDEWLYKREIVESKLRNLLGVNVSKKIGARKCVIDPCISSKEARKFCETNHIQGYARCKHRIGLRDRDDVLVALMTFAQPNRAKGRKVKEGSWELSRYCTSQNVMGGASKLLKYFIQNIRPKHLYSYADKRWSAGDLYHSLGFNFTHESKPGYWYVVGGKRIHRFELRKDVLVREYNGDPSLTEKQITSALGFNRIYDAGHLLFEMNL
jgi:mannose/fructose/N-acetylgalactosamine-specific phosphotransferase system component IIB